MKRIDTRAKDRAVLATLQARSKAGIALTISVRDITKVTGIPRGTVARSLKRLIDEGLIQRLPRSGHTQHADRYLLLTTQGEGVPTTFLWSKHGIGPTASLVYEAMPVGHWMTVKEICDRVDAGATTVRVNLKRLQTIGLIDGRNPHNDERLTKLQWCRLLDNGHIDGSTDWLTQAAREDVCEKITKEQNLWRIRESLRVAEEYKLGVKMRRGTAGGTSNNGASINPPKPQAEVA